MVRDGVAGSFLPETPNFPGWYFWLAPTRRIPMALSEKDLAAFNAVVDTLLPAVDGDGPAWDTPGADLGLEAGLPTVFDRLPHDQDRKDFKQFLGLLNAPPSCSL